MSAPDIVQLALALSRLLSEMEDLGAWPASGGGGGMPRARSVAEPDPTGDAVVSPHRARLRRRAQQLRRATIRHLERALEQAHSAVLGALDPELARRLREAEQAARDDTRGITQMSSRSATLRAEGGGLVPPTSHTPIRADRTPPA